MRSSLVVFGACLSLVTIPARADRPLTAEETAMLSSALAAEGCSGGELEFDDGEYEVEGATCADGKTYKIEFDSQFRIIKKKPKN